MKCHRSELRTPKHLGDYVMRLEQGIPFTLSNIGGDGEFLTMTGWDGTNSDGRESTPEKAAALTQTLLEPRLAFHGYNPGNLESKKRKNARRFLHSHGINIPEYEVGKGLTDPYFGTSLINVRWVHKEIISSANVGGRLNPFLHALRERPLFVIGPSTLSLEFLGDVLQCNVAKLYHEGWEMLDQIERDVAEVFDRYPNDLVVTWSLGYLTKVLMWRLRPQFPGVTQIDVGAIWDPYCGLLNRHGYRRPEWAECKAKNLEGLI